MKNRVIGTKQLFFHQKHFSAQSLSAAARLFSSVFLQKTNKNIFFLEKTFAELKINIAIIIPEISCFYFPLLHYF